MPFEERVPKFPIGVVIRDVAQLARAGAPARQSARPRHHQGRRAWTWSRCPAPGASRAITEGDPPDGVDRQRRSTGRAVPRRDGLSSRDTNRSRASDGAGAGIGWGDRRSLGHSSPRLLKRSEPQACQLSALSALIGSGGSARGAGAGPTQRGRRLQHIAEHGRAWQQASGYARRALAEVVTGRWKQVIGDGLRARKDACRASEAEAAVHALNRVLELARPTYVRTA
jgi:hypothetical protein